MFECSMLNPFGERLEIRGTSVYWINNGILVRKFTFSEGTNISSAIFTSFRASSQNKSLPNISGSKEDAIVIITTQCAHVYYLSGATFLVNLPYSITKVLSCDRGLILSRDTSNDEHHIDSFTIPNFFLMSDPLLDLGAIVSSSIASISLSEEIIFFGDSSTPSALCVTFDVKKATLKVYSVRHMSLQTSTFSNQFPVKIKDYSRRKSSRISSGNYDSTDAESTLEASIFNSRLDQSLSHTRDIGNLESIDGITINSISSFAGSQNIQKEVLLTLIESFRLSSHISNLDVHLFSYSSSYCVAVTDSAQLQAIFLTFEMEFSQKPSKFKGSQKIDAISVTPMNLVFNGLTREVAIILTPDSLVYFYDSFSQVQSAAIRFPLDWKRVVKLSIYAGSIYAVTEEGHYKTELSLEPHSSLVEKPFKILSLILEEPEFIAFNFLWTSILFTESSFTEWDAFVSAIILLFIPSNILGNSSHPFNSNHDAYSFSEQYSLYLATLQNFLGSAHDLILDNSNFRQQFIFSLFLIKEDARLDIAFQQEVELLEELLSHLSAWSDCLPNWRTSITIGETKRVTGKFM